MGQILLTQQATPNTPPAGSLAVYNDTNNNLRYITSTGSVGGIMNGRNRLINGAMEINQRLKTGTLASGDTMVDRFRLSQSASSTVTFTQSTDVPTNAQAGQSFQNSLNIQATSEASLDASDVISFYQVIEGYNIKDIIGDGYNNGFTISFWAKCTVAGTYCIYLSESTAGRCYVHECAITTAWTKITHTVTAVPSGGTWLKTNGFGLGVGICLMSGSNRKDGTNDTWVSTSDERATANQTFANNGVTVNWYFTGFQVEAGPVATPFEFRSFQQELALCQRYYFKTYELGTAPSTSTATSTLMYRGQVAGVVACGASLPFPVPMRISPTTLTAINNTGVGSAWRNISLGVDSGASSFSNTSDRGTFVNNAQVGGDGAGNGYTVHVTADAEL